MTHAGHMLHAIDVHRRQAVVVDFPRDAVRRSSFLDDRALQPGMGGWRVSLDEIETALAGAGRRSPHWLFHLGHVGSTAVSRCLDLCPGVLGLREPLPLLALAHERGHPDARRWLGVTLSALSRTFPGDRAVVVKPTSVVTVLAETLLAPRDARGCLLWSRLDMWLASLLRDAGLVAQVLDTAPVRALPDPLPDTTATALAMLWVHEQRRWQALASRPGFAGRLIDVEFDLRTGDAPNAARRAAVHFGIELPPDFAARIAASGIVDHDAKQPGRRFDAFERGQALLASLRTHAQAIETALDAARAHLQAGPHGCVLEERLRAP